jgi:putative MFS transporter
VIPGGRALHRRVTLLAGLAFASNGLNLGVISFALLGLRASWGLTPGQAGALVMSTGAGQLAGGILAGYAADRTGRRMAYAGAVGLSSLALGAAALASTLPALAALLFLAGVGFGGVAPAAISLVGEFAPRGTRGALLGWTQVLWVGGWIVAASGALVVGHSLGWRAVLLVGLLPVILAAAAPWAVPESPRYLLAHGRRAEAEALARALALRFGESPELPPQERAGRVSLPAHLAEVWSPRFRQRTLLIWLVWFIMIAAYNGPVVWLPPVFAASGVPDPARAAFWVSAAMILPVVGASLLIDRAGRRPVLITALLVGAAGASGVAGARAPLALMVAAAALAGGVLAAWPVILTYAAELYPTRIRGSAAGLASAAGRGGGIVSPVLLGVLMRSWTSGRWLAFNVFAAGLVLAALIVVVLGEETAGRALEEVAEAV